MIAVGEPITPDELLDMPDDGMRREIHDGVLVEMSPSGDVASGLGNNIGRILGNYVIEHRLGRVTGADGGFILSEDPYVLLVPDTAFVSRERVKPYNTKFYILAPDLAVEVISPSERADDIFTKVQTYLQYGTKLVWVVYPQQRRVMVYRLGIETADILDTNGTLDGDDVLPGFTLAVRDIFAVLDE